MRRKQVKWSIKGTFGAIVCAASLVGTLAGVAHSQFFCDPSSGKSECMQCAAGNLQECMNSCNGDLAPTNCQTDCACFFGIQRTVCVTGTNTTAGPCF
jgi:hypothetical protein